MKKIITILSVSIFCNAMCFFGYVYEEVVDIPNMFGNSPTVAKQFWTGYHSVTSPGYYHAVPAIIAIICIIALWYFRKDIPHSQQRYLQLATCATILSNALTGIAVTQLNNQLFFGPHMPSDDAVRTIATYWAALNLIRLIVVFICIITLVKLHNAFIRSFK